MESDETTCDSCLKLKKKNGVIKKYIFACNPPVKSNSEIENATTIDIAESVPLLGDYHNSKYGLFEMAKMLDNEKNKTFWIHLCNACVKKSKKNLTFDVNQFVDGDDDSNKMIKKPVQWITRTIIDKAHDDRMNNLRSQLFQNQMNAMLGRK